eukprot:TRINITY_DN3862_c0_g1_i2.p1 TRINITY_DN3862_c0_g1~~TRINITY_DN3862_c0_g1_i2.p1  ORF type:complete len:153 (+),score=25.49 TRINITY_DN3862_c0_g1_i2:19-477(+)
MQSQQRETGRAEHPRHDGGEKQFKSRGSRRPAPKEGFERRKNQIQVSMRAKSVYFYSNLVKRFLMNEPEVEISALGFAITTVVSISEILKKTGAVVLKKIETSTADMSEFRGSRQGHKAKLTITVVKGPHFDELMRYKPDEIDEEEADAYEA